MAQADFQDVFGLPFGEGKTRHQRRFGFVRFPDQVDDFVDVEKDDVPPFEDVDAVLGAGQAIFAAPPHRGQAEDAPFADQVDQGFLAGPSVEADGDQVDRRVGFQAGVGEQQGDEFVTIQPRAGRFEDEADGVVLAGFVARPVELRGEEVFELRGGLFDGLFAGLGLRVHQAADFGEHLGRRNAGWQFAYHQLPGAPRHFLEIVAGAHAQAAASGAVGAGDFRRGRDDLPAAGVVRAGEVGHQCGEVGIRVLQEVNRRVGDFAEVVCGHFGGHAHGDAGSPVQERKRQAGRQESRFVEGAVVIGLEVDGAFGKLTEQQFGNRGEARFGVTHRRRAVAVA